MTTPDFLRKHVQARAENRPGVYRMTGEGGEILYVGKSVRVRSRLLSYFRAAPGEKAAELIRQTTAIHWRYLPNEFAAVLTEMRQIKQWRPRFNVEHNRKRIYTFAKLTVEPAPRILATTRVTEDRAEYFGPFPNAGRVTDTLRELSLILGLRDCPGTTPVFFGDQMEFFGGTRLPYCFRADLRTCLAPCAGRCSESEYMDRVAAARAFLSGNGRATLADLQRKMEAAADRLDFEYAALLRNRLARLERLQEDLVALRGRTRSRTFVYKVPGFGGGTRLYVIREGRVVADLPTPRSTRQMEETVSRVEGILRAPPRRSTGLSAAEAAEVILVGKWFRLRKDERKRTVPVKRWLSQTRERIMPAAPSPRPG